LWILLSGSCGVEEDKGTASAVANTNDAARCVWVGIGRSGPAATGSLAWRCYLSPLPFWPCDGGSRPTEVSPKIS